MNDNDKTVVEADKTIVEDDRTIVESRSSTSAFDHQLSSTVGLGRFRDYILTKAFPVKGGESDIFLAERESEKVVLKLYRYGINPGEDVLSKAKQLSEKFPEHIISIYDQGYDSHTARWYEIQEYAPSGSLKEILKACRDRGIVKTVITEISTGLDVLHKNEILHLDLKPSNILVKSKNPLDLVFTDFGISSLLDSELSKKITSVKGTPLYWSPESFTGVVGKETDWWALGVLILEMLAGRHPLADLDTKVIMYTLSTRGLDIPREIPGEYVLLLKGLLTRDPQKRWSCDQTKRWLNGEENIPVYFSDETHDNKRYRFPFVGHNREYFNMEELAEGIIEDEDSWEEWQEYLKRGYISKWLAKNDILGVAVRVDKIMERTEGDPDLALLTVIYTFSKSIPFVFYGKLITPGNLYITVGKVLKEEASKGERTIVNTLLDGRLLSYYKEYLRLTKREKDSFFTLLEGLTKAVLNELADENRIRRLAVLDILIHSDAYIIPVEIKRRLYDHVDFIVDHIDGFIRRDEYATLVEEYIIPDEIKREIAGEKTNSYFKAASLLKSLKRDGSIINKRSFEDLTRDYIVPAEIERGIWEGNFQQHKECSLLLRYLETEELLIEKSEFEDINSRYIIPGNIKREIEKGDIAAYKGGAKKFLEIRKKSYLLTEEDILSLCRADPGIFLYLEGKNDSADSNELSPDSNKKLIAKRWIKRFKSDLGYFSRYVALARHKNGVVDLSLFSVLDMLDKELAIVIDNIGKGIPVEIMGYNYEHKPFVRLKGYIEALRSGKVDWAPIDREIVDAFSYNMGSTSREMEMSLRKRRGKSAFTSFMSGVLLGFFNNNSFMRLTREIYHKYHNRIDGLFCSFKNIRWDGNIK